MPKYLEHWRDPILVPKKPQKGHIPLMRLDIAAGLPCLDVIESPRPHNPNSYPQAQEVVAQHPARIRHVGCIPSNCWHGILDEDAAPKANSTGRQLD